MSDSCGGEEGGTKEVHGQEHCELAKQGRVGERAKRVAV